MLRYLTSRTSVISILFLLLTNLGTDVPSAYTQLQTFNILPAATDNQIDQALDVHYLAIDRSVTRTNKLMLFFPGTGGVPRGYKAFTELSANLGFHGFALQYVNLESVNTLCGGSNTDLTCYEKCRMEIIDGLDRTPLVNVNRANSIENRLIKALKYMHTNNPGDGWLQYVTANDEIVWDKIVVAGHSQGGGHAGILGKKRRVARVLMFSSADYNVATLSPAAWVLSPGITPNTDFYGFIHQRDQFFNYSVISGQVWPNLGITALGPPVNVDTATPPFGGTHAFNSDWTVLPIPNEYHNATVVDGRFPIGATGSLYRPVWEYMLKFPNSGKPFDLDGDNKTDLSIFRPNGAASEWWWLKSSGGNAAVVFGANTDTIVPADYTGDGKTDVAFWRPSTGFWYVLRSEDQTFYAFPFGASGDVPVPADYDADGKADVGVFRPTDNTWYLRRSGDGGTIIQQFGVNGDVPVNADYDGDGKADIAIYRPSLGQWWLMRSSAGTVAYQFGNSTDKTVVGDYTGDGKADVAFWRPATGEWYVLRSEDTSFFAFPFGVSTDTPVPGDYDGDGKQDAGVFRSSNSTWYVQRSTAGTLIQQFGTTGDVPLPNAYVR